MKLGIALDEDLLKRADKYADEHYMSRSGLISLALVNYLNAAEVQGYMREMVLLLRKISEKGDFDSETLEQLEDLSRVAQMFGAAKQ